MLALSWADVASYISTQVKTSNEMVLTSDKSYAELSLV